MLRTLCQPCVGWLLLAVLYLTAAVLSVFLTVATHDWWPLLLAVASMLASTRCVLTGLTRHAARAQVP